LPQTIVRLKKPGQVIGAGHCRCSGGPISYSLGPYSSAAAFKFLNLSQFGLSDVWMIVTHLHHDYTGLEFSFGRAFKKVVNFLLNLLTDLLLSTFLAYRAGDILDFNEVGLHCRSG
jgi:hypothetical protein